MITKKEFTCGFSDCDNECGLTYYQREYEDGSEVQGMSCSGYNKNRATCPLWSGGKK